jgi:hypothetical protein
MDEQATNTTAGPPSAGPDQGSRLARFGRWVVPHGHGPGWAVACGLFLTIGQLAFVYSQCYDGSVGGTYQRLLRADSLWYRDIAEEGYHSTVPPGGLNRRRDNVAFFPGFPLFARILGNASGLPGNLAVLLAAQLACWGFWAWFLIFLQRWQASPTVTACAVGLVAAHPCAFYLVAGYSESLFMMTLLGFLYWADRDGTEAWWLAGAHGFVMTATRIVGVPIAFAPLLLCFRPAGGDTGSLLTRPHKATLARLLALAAVASLGGLLFFAYCQWRFGCWDLYMQTQRNGWGLKPDYLAVFRPEVYEVFMPRDGPDGFVSPRELSRLSVPLTLALLIGALVGEVWAAWCQRDGGWWKRAPLHFAAWCMFYISVCGLVAVRMNSMIRYTLPIHALLVLAVAGLCGRNRPSGVVGDLALGLVGVVVVHSLWLQSVLVYHFTLGHWVA